jgi:hypothetical protein
MNRYLFPFSITEFKYHVITSGNDIDALFCQLQCKDRMWVARLFTEIPFQNGVNISKLPTNLEL